MYAITCLKGVNNTTTSVLPGARRVPSSSDRDPELLL
jgi:hypothetical protein